MRTRFFCFPFFLIALLFQAINRKEWVLSDMACVQYNFVSIPLVVTLDDETLIFILNQSEVRCVIASPDLAPRVAAVADKCPLLRGLVVMGDQILELETRIEVVLFGDVIKAGDDNFPGDYAGRLRKGSDLMTVRKNRKEKKNWAF